MMNSPKSRSKPYLHWAYLHTADATRAAIARGWPDYWDEQMLKILVQADLEERGHRRVFRLKEVLSNG